ncbi:MAG: carbohydrate ABC transporter permease [Anaerolineales bacterium]|nr:carbohydrate ABC transporter permease [Anaerolineales bacterium]
MITIDDMNTKADQRDRSLRRVRTFLSRAGVYFIAIFVALTVIFPLIWILLTAFKSLPETYIWPPTLLPANWRFDSFSQLFQVVPFARFFLNSVWVSLPICILNLLFCSLAGYVFAKFQFPGKSILFIIVLATIMIPFQVTMIPAFSILVELGWNNSYLGLIVPGMVGAFGIFLMRQFMMSIPTELIEAARIDGAGEFRIYTQIIIPSSKPAFAALAIFTFLENWNSFLWPLIVIDTPQMRTLPLGLALLKTQFISQWPLIMAATLLSSLPVILVYIIFQRQFIRGILLTGLKQ